MKRYAILDVIWDLLFGKLIFADSTTVVKRIGICNSCEARNTKLNTCTVCGCYLPFKTRVSKSSCPMDLW